MGFLVRLSCLLLLVAIFGSCFGSKQDIMRSKRATGTVFFSGLWGHMRRQHNCPHNKIATSFSVQSEKHQPGNRFDDTAMNGLKFKCQGGKVIFDEGYWGSWSRWKDCPQGFSGARARIEGNQGGGDDTGTNCLQLRCGDRVLDPGNCNSWGKWSRWEYCPGHSKICGFRVQYEEKQGSGDDTALNGIGLTCC